MLGRYLQQGQVDGPTDVENELVASLGTLGGMRFVVELDCAQNHEIACATHDEVEVL